MEPHLDLSKISTAVLIEELKRRKLGCYPLKLSFEYKPLTKDK